MVLTAAIVAPLPSLYGIYHLISLLHSDVSRGGDKFFEATMLSEMGMVQGTWQDSVFDEK